MTGKRGPQIEKLLLEGCLPQDIDRVMEGYGMAMGPLATGDLAGLDIGAAVRKARGTVAPVADAVVAPGGFGQKTCKGYYDYDENRKRMPAPGGRGDHPRRRREDAGPPPQDRGPGDPRARCCCRW